MTSSSAEAPRSCHSGCRVASDWGPTGTRFWAAIACGKSMPEAHADALVFFGATGDLAYQQVFPALQALTRRGPLDIPVIGVAKPEWTTDKLRARTRDSVTAQGGVDDEAFAKLANRLSYVAGDYQASDTFDRLRD